MFEAFAGLLQCHEVRGRIDYAVYTMRHVAVACVRRNVNSPAQIIAYLIVADRYCFSQITIDDFGELLEGLNKSVNPRPGIEHIVVS
jgi:hypothetical protein